MKLFGSKILLMIIAIIGLTACSASFEEVLEETNTAVESVFNNEADKTNNRNDDIEYHVPFGVEKKEEEPNNILLKNGSRTYILFYNQHEDSGSKVVYESTLNQQPEWDANETFEKDGEFGYLLVKKLDEDNYHIVTGVGGVKLTTESQNLKSDAVTMMQIANSVKVN